MSLISRLTTVIQAIGADIKALQIDAGANAFYSHVFAGIWPTNITGTYRDHPDGVQTYVLPTDGKYRVTLEDVVLHTAPYTYENTGWTIGGTATRLDSGGTFDAWLPSSGQDGNRAETHVAYFQGTAGQTITFLPKCRLGAASGVNSSHTFSFLAAVELITSKQGPKGDTGNNYIDANPVGAVTSWSRKTIPGDYVLANGQRLTKVVWPDAYAVAQAEVAAGNPLWTVRTTDETFTVPDLTDKFVLQKGATRDVGATGGEETHLLTGPESGVQAHTHDTYGYDAPNVGTGGGIGYLRNLWNMGSAVTGAVTGGAKNATTAHNNMPPYVVLAYIVKLRGAVVTGGALVGPTGAAGPSILQETDKIQWVRTADGALIADKGVTTSAGADKSATVTERATAAGNGIATILLSAANGTPASRLRLKNDPTQTTRKRKVTAEVYDDSGTVLLSRDILRSDGSSDLGKPLIVDTLPTVGVVDGDEVYYQNASMANNSVVWHLRYNANSPNTDKWELVGGGFFFARDPSSTNTLASGAQNFAGPQHTIPLAGYYEISQGWNAFPNSNQGLIQSDLYNGSNVIIDATGENSLQGWVTSTSPGPNRANPSRIAMCAVRLTAGQSVKMSFNGDVANLSTRWRSLGIRPMRVSG